MTINTAELNQIQSAEITGNSEIVEKSKKGLKVLKEKLEKLGTIENLTPLDSRPLDPSEVPAFNTIWKDFTFSEMEKWRAYSRIPDWEGLWSGQTDENGLSTVYEIHVKNGGHLDNDKDGKNRIDEVFIIKTVGRMEELEFSTKEPITIESEFKKLNHTPPLDINTDGGYQVAIRYDSAKGLSSSTAENIRLDVGASRDRYGLPSEPEKHIHSLYYKL